MVELLADLKEVMGERRAVLSREMTKKYEEFLRGSLSDIIADVRKRKDLKGECTLLLEGSDRKTEISPEALRNIIMQELDQADKGVSALSREISEQYNVSKKQVYAEILKIKAE
jgi:16S rRNA (cytidine1402-2'-O)-methyltransferase